MMVALMGGLGCDSGATESAEPQGPDAVTLAPTTPWTAGSGGTGQVPAYGSSCRLEAESSLSLPANEGEDDALTLLNTAGGYALTLTLSTGAGGDASVTLNLSQGLSLRSFRDATGTVVASGDLSELTGDVVDGALCFESKLSPGTAVLGEFSIVSQRADGTYMSVGGDFSVPAGAVFPQGATTDELMVGADNLKVDLQ